MGYIKKKSKKSAIAGGASGAVMLVAALLMRSPGTLKLGFFIACGEKSCLFPHSSLSRGSVVLYLPPPNLRLATLPSVVEVPVRIHAPSQGVHGSNQL